MALTTKSMLEHIARYVASRLSHQAQVAEAWVQFEEDQYQVLVLVKTGDLAAERRARSIYAELLSAFPGQEIDLYVTNKFRTPIAAWHGLIAPSARRIET